MANSSGIKLIPAKWFANAGSWNAIRWENLARYSWITAVLSFRKKLCRYFGMKADRHANAWAR